MDTSLGKNGMAPTIGNAVQKALSHMGEMACTTALGEARGNVGLQGDREAGLTLTSASLTGRHGRHFMSDRKHGHHVRLSRSMVFFFCF